MASLPDNYDLWKSHEEEREAEAEKCPECAYCGEKIFDAFAFYIDGEWYHKDCFESEYYVEVIEE
jgi:hypothetical protein